MPKPAMSSRLTRLAVQVVWARPYYTFSTGGLQRTGAFRAQRTFHNAVMVRNASFVRFLPKLFVKFTRLPAMFGGLILGGVAWVQYQAIQVSNSAQEMYGTMKTTVRKTASSLLDGTMDIAEQTKRGWTRTKDNIAESEWVQAMLRLHEHIGTSGGGPGGDKEPERPKKSSNGAAAAVAAAYGYEQSGDDDRDAAEAVKDDQMMRLTKWMIEIRSLLQEVGQSSTLALPSIVVIGSQSSGKSSVLEAIVGHEFLPKGSNMVTRRPIELTLVNTPNAKVEYGEFPDLGQQTADFAAVQRTLTELNLSVPDEVCVSDEPIRLMVYSANVPDLSLIDLPGYIQVVGHNQPLELKRKISELCDKYIQPPNIILAISAADVDLANSAALQASRRVDPRGERTIGVITKMDLVDPARGMSILTDRQYPLRLGYVGVVSKAPSPSGLFKKDTGNLTALVSRNENAYFSSHPYEFGPQSGVSVGTCTLRRKLMYVLEQTMSSSLRSTNDGVRQELEEVSYQLKAKYNDRPLSAEAYLARSLDEFKQAFQKMAGSFGPEQVLDLVKGALDQQVMDLLALRYWNGPVQDISRSPPDAETIAKLPEADPNSLYWNRQLEASLSALTRLGVGRLGTSVVTAAIQTNIERLVNQSPFADHALARQKIMDAASSILDARFSNTSKRVEYVIEPCKSKVKIDDKEWEQGRSHVVKVLKEELSQCQAALKRLEQNVGGRRKLRDVMAFIDKVRKGELVIEGSTNSGAGGFSAALLAHGRQAVFLHDRADIINMRIRAVNSKQCKVMTNKQYCPEVFLDAVATKLASQTVPFLDLELLEGFIYSFPRELDERLGRLSKNELEALAKENTGVRDHLELIRRKDLLERALSKLEGLRQLEALEKGKDLGVDLRSGRSDKWSLF